MGDHVDPYRLYLHYPQPHLDAVATDNPASLADYYGEEEGAIVKEELGRLFGAFRTQILYGRRHYAPSASWRDEMTTHSNGVPMPQRFVVRVHLFENRGDQAGRYLGFVSLRPPGTTHEPRAGALTAEHALRYVIDAELGIPAYMQRPRYHVLTTTAASARLGVLPFRSAVYSAAGLSERRGSACVHLAVSQALHLIMGRFGCRPISQIEFDWYLWKTAKEEMSIGEMGQRGARLSEALQVIRSSCNGGGFQVTVEPREEPGRGLTASERGLASRFLTDALACGLPVIALVRAGNLLAPEARAGISEAQLNTPHAVLVLGMHLLHCHEEIQGRPEPWDNREDLAELPGRLIIHDTLSRGPYFECMISDFLDAAEATYEGDAAADGSSGVHLLVVGPERMEMGHHQARVYAEKNLLLMLRMLSVASGDRDIAALMAYLHAAEVPLQDARKTDDWRLICRLLSTPELKARYEGQPEMLESFGSFADLPTSYFWVLELRHPRARRVVRNGHVHCPADLSPAMVFVWDCRQPPNHHVYRAASPSMILRYHPTQPSP